MGSGKESIRNRRGEGGEMSDDKQKLDPVTQAIREILKGAHPDWVVVSRSYIKELANRNNVSPDALILKPLPEEAK